VIARRAQIELHRALVTLRERKPGSEPLPHQLADLIEWWLERYSRTSATGEVEPFNLP